MALHYPPLTRNVGCFVTIAATLAVCAFLGVTGVAAGPRYLSNYVGTLGGPDATAVAINAAGDITGSSSVEFNGASHAFVYSGHDLLDLGVLYDSPGAFSAGVAINDNGQVTGRMNGPDGFERAFLWDRVSGMRDLGTLGGWGSAPRAINRDGVVVGTALTVDQSARAFRYQGGEMQDLGTLGGQSSYGLGVNNAGDVTGEAGVPSPGYSHAFRYARGNMQDLGTLPAPYDQYSYGVLINDAGQVAGVSCSAEWCHIFLYSDQNGMVDITPELAGWPWPVGLSATGQVAIHEQRGDGGVHALQYRDGHTVDIGHLGGDFTMAMGANNRGDIVGMSMTTDYTVRPILYRDGVLTNLADATPIGNGLALYWATAINDAGQVAVQGGTPSDRSRGRRHYAPYRLSPVPER